MKKKFIFITLTVLALIVIYLTIHINAESIVVGNYDISATSSDSVTATLYDDGKGEYSLVISGSGKMKNFKTYDDKPWSEYCKGFSFGLKKVVVEEGVTNIGDYTFHTQSGLEELELPDTVTEIGKNAFTYCKFTDLIMSDNIVSLGESAFLGCKVEKLKISEGLTKISESAFNGTDIVQLEIPESVDTIEKQAFYDCDSLTYVYIPETVNTIEHSAFSLCNNLEVIEIAKGVTNISYLATYCDKLTKLTVPSSIQTIDSSQYSIVDKSDKVTVYFNSNTIAEEHFSEYDVSCVIDDNAPEINDIIISETEWTNKDVTITIQAEDELSGLARYAYSFDGGKTWQAENYKTYSENTEGIVIHVRDCLYNTLEYSEVINITNIDKINPTIEAVTGNVTEWVNQDVTLTITATDDLSGLAEEAYSFDGGETWQAENSKTYEENTNGINVQIRDNAGNVTRYTEIIDITKIDKVNPIIEAVTGNAEEWTNQDVTLTIKATDDLSGLAEEAYSFDGGETWQVENTKTYEENTNGINVQIRDNAGNVTRYTEIIDITKIDKVNPTIESVTGNIEEWFEGTVTLTINGVNDNLSGLAEEAYSFDGGETWQVENSKTYEDNTNGIIIQVRDNAQNIYVHEEINVTKIMKATSIKVIENPKKLEYDPYENFDSEGMKIQVEYDNGESRETENYTVLNGEELTCKTSRIEIQYNKNTEIKIELEGIKVGHIEEVLEVKAPTCTEVGLAEGKHCSICKEVLIVQEEIPVLGHSFTTYESNNDAKCEEDGTETSKCDRCEETDTRTVVESALGHNYESIVTDPTCTEDGYTTHTCSRCQDTYTDEEKEALDHSFTTYESNNDAKCEEDGTETSKCDRCEETDTRTEEGSALDHSFTTYESNNDAKCEEDGTETSKCDRCEETDTKVEEGSRLGHSFTTYVSNNDAKCEEDGTETSKCDRCEETDTRTEEGSALDHSFTTYESNNDAKCEEDGTETSKCDRCEETDTKVEEGSRLGHSFTTYVSNNDAKCEEDGTETSKCDRCEETDTRTEEGSALDHSFTTYESNNDAKCEEDGTETSKCDRCEETDTKVEEGSRLGHSFTTYVSNNDAKCEEDGTETAKCERCEETDTKVEEGSRLGHSFTTYISNNDAKCEEDGTETSKCDRCEETDTKVEEGSELGHNYENGTCTNCGGKEPKLEILTEKYNVQNSYITQIQAKTTVKEMKENMQTNSTEVNVYNKNNELQSDTSKLATGMIVEFKFNNKTYTYTVVVSGDIDGDGEVKFTDMVILNRHRLKKRTLEGAYLLSADVTGDGKVDFIDLVKINRFRLKKIQNLLITR